MHTTEPSMAHMDTNRNKPNQPSSCLHNLMPQVNIIKVSGKSSGGSSYTARAVEAYNAHPERPIIFVIGKGQKAPTTLNFINKKIRELRTFVELITGKPCDIKIKAVFGNDEGSIIGA